MMNNEKEKDAIDTSKLDEILPKYDPLKLNSINLAQNYVSAFNTGMNIYQCVNQLQGYIEWVVKAVNDVVKSWNVQVGESIDQSKAIVRETTTEQFNTEWTNKQPELIEQVNTLTTNQFNEDWGVLENRINTTLENQNTKINSIQTQQTNLANEQTTLSNRMDTFTSLSAGSTTGDAELQDIRVGANGVTYNNAGNAVRGQYSQLKEDLSSVGNQTDANTEDLAEITEKHGTEITADLFEWGIVDSNGIVTQDTETTLRNIYSEIISIKGAVITPLQSNTIFKVVYYSENGSYISSTPWMGLSSFTIVESYTVDSDYCRICIADATQDVGTTEISQHLAKYSFRGNTEKFVNGNKIAFHNNEIEEKISLPFIGFRIEHKLYKQNGKYYSKINPRDNYVENTNGVVVYMSPDGSNSNDGLTVITPVKSLQKALDIENVNTIICLEGTYVSGINFSVGQIITKEVNIIGIGNVVFDNLTNACIRFYRTIYCENIHFKGGDTAVACELATYDRKATFYKCTFSESFANNGLSILGGIAYVIDCISFGNAFDGFNYHAKETVVNHSIEINCKSYGNGTKRLTESDGQSSNATTSHDGSYIVRINGDYKCCHGGVVADKECKSANYACSSGVSTVTDTAYTDRMSNYWSSNAEMYLFDCVSFGSKYDTAKINGGTIRSNIEYASNYPS